MIVNACIKKYKSATDFNLFIDYCNGVNTKLVAPRRPETSYDYFQIYTQSLYAYYLDSFKKVERSYNGAVNHAGFNNYYIKTNYASRGSEIYLENYSEEHPINKYLRLLIPGIGGITDADSLELLDASYNIKHFTLKSLANLKYVNYNSVTNIGANAFYNCPNLKEIYLPKITTILHGSSIGLAPIYNCKNLDFIYLGPNITDIPRYFLYESTVNDALYIDKPRAEVEQFTGYAYRFSNNQLAPSKIICNDDPNWVKPISKNPGIPISHIIQPIYKYNITWSKAYYDFFKKYDITDDIFTKPLLVINKYFCTDHFMDTRYININSATLLKSYGINSDRLTHVSLNGVTHMETHGIYGTRNLTTLNLNGLKTYDEDAIIATDNMVINLQSIVTLDKTLISYAAKKVYLDSVETINGLNASDPVFERTTNTIYYIGPNIRDMNDYVFSRNTRATVYIDIPRATLETFSGYAKLFNNGGTNLTVICNDDPDWKSAEELRAED